MAAAPIIVWFRSDLRLADNQALFQANQMKAPVIPVFVFSSEDEGTSAAGAASRWWLHHSLKSLSSQLSAVNSQLIIERGPAVETICRMVDAIGARAVYWNRRFEPEAKHTQEKLKGALGRAKVEWCEFDSTLLHDPDQLLTNNGLPYKVFTPFWNALQKLHIPQPIPNVVSLIKAKATLRSIDLDDLNLLPKINWDAGLAASWEPGQSGAHRQLDLFLSLAMQSYPEGRDTPGKSLVSRLSPHLHFGEVSPRLVWHRVQQSIAADSANENGGRSFLRELAWREFAYYLLHHFPHTVDQPLRSEFARFPWRDDRASLRLWQKGQTGYPIVDAGMRELWYSGWMHNRVRMIVASFLVKDLLIDWREGARWFWDTLVDADLANNTLGWQWTAGCGADAAPYFRIFNPTLQAEKFDREGEYVRKWCPELGNLPSKFIHKPWQAPPEVLDKAKVNLGKTYPQPIVDHASARKRALLAFQSIKKDELLV